MSLNNRPDTPAEAQFYVRLVTESPIRKESGKKFFKMFEKYSPEGIMTVYEVADPDGGPAQAPLVHRVDENGEHQYEIPLVRNLTPNEIEEIAIQLNSSFNEGNFLFETSTFEEDCCLYEDDEEDYVEPKVTEQIATRLAERMHDVWMHERLDNGWHYNKIRSDRNKTHPLIMPWNQLSEEHKTIDYNLPQTFIDLLEEFGYTIISEEELNELIKEASKKR